MLHQHTLEKLHALRLIGMARAFEQQLAQPATQELAFEERFGLLLDQEILYRDNRRVVRLLKAAVHQVGDGQGRCHPATGGRRWTGCRGLRSGRLGLCGNGGGRRASYGQGRGRCNRLRGW